MLIYGIMMVRNEVDLLQVNLLHHLAHGVDAFLIVDNGSTDGTVELLEELGRDERVIWTRFEGPYRQAEITTALAREAYLRGADWIVPIDTDEFWWTPKGDLKRVLSESSAAALELEVVNFVQCREQLETDERALLGMTRRVQTVAGDWEEAKQLVVDRRIGFVEIMYPPKWISRAAVTLEISMGNHQVWGEVGRKEKSSEILCLHAPLRSRALLEAKMADHGQRSMDLGAEGNLWWQARRWHEVLRAGDLEAEWRANSYTDSGLDVYGETRPLVEDGKLRDVVEPWLEHPPLATVPVRRKVGAEALRIIDGDVLVASFAEPVSRAFLEYRLQKQESAIAHLLEEVALRDQHLAERHQDLAYLRDELDQREEGNAWLREKLDEANQALNQRDAAIVWLREKLDEANQALSQRDAEPPSQTP